MTENPSKKPELSDELHELGKNLSDFLRTAWASDERKKVQKDIEFSLSELGVTIDQAANKFSESETGQRLKTDLQDFSKRVETGDVQDKARKELYDALKKVNEELSKVTNKWRSNSSSPSSETGVNKPSSESTTKEK